MAIKILGTGAYLPEKIITNDDLAKMVETSDEWITQRVGIKERRISETETAADFAVNAAKEALKSADIDASQLDLIIAASISAENLCPTIAGTVQKEIGATCPAFDINSACSGFMFALDTAVSYIARGNVKKALIIGTERLSKLVDWEDRSTCVIFGDGAGAMIVEPGDGYLVSKLFTQGGDDVIKIPAFGGTSPFYTSEKPAPYIFMDGQETFKFAVNKIVTDVKEVVEQAGLTLDEVDHIVLHQANTRILDFAAKRLKVSKDKIIVNIHKYGNTAAASVPIVFDELAKSGRLKRGDIVVMSAFGGGLSSGTCLIRY